MVIVVMVIVARLVVVMVVIVVVMVTTTVVVMVTTAVVVMVMRRVALGFLVWLGRLSQQHEQSTKRRRLFRLLLGIATCTSSRCVVRWLPRRRC